MPVPIPENDDPFDLLRYLGAEICQTLIDMADSDATDAQLEAACDRLHALAGELWLCTSDIRKGRN